jgi:hypothetical protein
MPEYIVLMNERLTVIDLVVVLDLIAEMPR